MITALPVYGNDLTVGFHEKKNHQKPTFLGISPLQNYPRPDRLFKIVWNARSKRCRAAIRLEQEGSCQERSRAVAEASASLAIKQRLRGGRCSASVSRAMDGLAACRYLSAPAVRASLRMGLRILYGWNRRVSKAWLVCWAGPPG